MLGRGQKVGKEEIVGMVKALELYLDEDHDALNTEWQQRLDNISAKITAIKGVTTQMTLPEIANHVPQHADHLGSRSSSPSRRATQQKPLRSGKPSDRARSRRRWTWAFDDQSSCCSPAKTTSSPELFRAHRDKENQRGSAPNHDRANALRYSLAARLLAVRSQRRLFSSIGRIFPSQADRSQPITACQTSSSALSSAHS